MSDPQAAYAIASARVAQRLAELQAALMRHEQAKRWDENEVLERLDVALASTIEALR